MKIPEFIEINNCRVSVIRVKNLYRDYSRYGDYDVFEMQIRLDESMGDDKSETVFFHELVEAIVDINLMEMEEYEKQAFALSLYSLCKSNQIRIGD